MASVFSVFHTILRDFLTAIFFKKIRQEYKVKAKNETKMFQDLRHSMFDLKHLILFVFVETG